MSDEKLTPERAVRLLRAKGAELEQQAKTVIDNPLMDWGYLAAAGRAPRARLAFAGRRSERGA